MPRKAIFDDVEGTVVATATILSGKVSKVTIISGPEELRDAVRTAMAQYRCAVLPTLALATQSFRFVLKH